MSAGNMKPELLRADQHVFDLEPESDDPPPVVGPRRPSFWRTIPAWMISMLVHVALLLTLASISTTPAVEIVNVLTSTSVNDEITDIEEYEIEKIDSPEEIEDATEENLEEPVDEPPETLEVSEPSPLEPMQVASVKLETAEFAEQMAPSDSLLQTLDVAAASALGGRSAQSRKELLRRYGGTDKSESAVSNALRWLALHQMSNGAWTFQHDMVCQNGCGDACKVAGYAQSFNGATSMALLPFLGAGQTHYQGEYKEVVRQGLLFLIGHGERRGNRNFPMLDLRDSQGNLYSHGLAAITLCEAYGMTNDPALAEPAQSALNFTIAAQNRDGGWRYHPDRKSMPSDTSAVGWQLMALKSGYMAHLFVPTQSVQRSVSFLNSVQSHGGAVYGYIQPSDRFHASTTAVGLLCRMYTGWDKNEPAIVRGVTMLSDRGIIKEDLYYNYYAAQVLRHYGGEKWDKYNEDLRDWLVSTQDDRPGYNGSWYWQKNRHLSNAGRLCSTSLATLILEVYYRHMPLYADNVSEDEFPL